jgi:hypothetical protein
VRCVTRVAAQSARCRGGSSLSRRESSRSGGLALQVKPRGMTTDPKARVTELEAENTALREQLELLASEDCFKGDKQRLA